MMMLALALLFLLSAVATATDPATTYSHQDPTTGETLLCGSCQPGTHRVAHCTATTPTQCAPCRENHFTALWNYLPRCLYCNHICIQNQEVETECSPVSNRVCRCKPGYYLMDDFCDKHSECGLGYGVQTAGTHQKDTVCEKCPSGYFSNSSSQLDSCMKHQECGNGQLVLLAGSAYHDTVCGACEDFANGGETLRTFFSAFFSGWMPKRDLKHFINRVIHKSEENKSASRQRGFLVDQIRAWLAQASPVQMKVLPKALKDSHLGSMADKLEERLGEIRQQNPTCSM